MDRSIFNGAQAAKATWLVRSCRPEQTSSRFASASWLLKIYCDPVKRIIGASRPGLWSRRRWAGRQSVGSARSALSTAVSASSGWPCASSISPARVQIVLFSVASPSRMSEESQRAWSQFQTPPARYAAMGDWEGELRRFAPILRLCLDSSRGCCPPTRQFLRRSRERSFDHFPY